MANYYVRPVNGADVAGQGTTHATAYQTPQFALNDIGATHGQGVNGDQVNICDEGVCTLGAALSLAGYGATAWDRPLILRGYTAVANDGGQGILDGAGAFAMIAGSPQQTHLVNLWLRNSGATNLVTLGIRSNLLFCTLSDTTGAAATGTVSGIIRGCYIYNAAKAWASTVATWGKVLDSFLVLNAANVYGIGTDGHISGNIVLVTNVGVVTAITGANYGSMVDHNIAVSTVACTGSGLTIANLGSTAMNNIVTGFSGVGGKGLNRANGYGQIDGYNAYWNNTTPRIAGITSIYLGGDVTLGADPFINAAAGNFMLTDVAKAALRSAGWPASYLGAAATDPHLTIGPVQYGEAVSTVKSFPPIGRSFILPDGVRA